MSNINSISIEQTDYIIVNFWNTINYGASLTAWAMQELIKSYGCSCLLLNHNDFWNFDSYNNSFSKNFAEKFLDISKIYNNNDLKFLSKNIKGVILGSDQVLRLEYINHNLYKYLLNWVDNNTRKIALSASFGINQQEYENVKIFRKNKKYIKNAIKSFDYLSCREISGKDIYKNVFKLNSDFILDPVFLIDSKKYDNIISQSSIDNQNKIVSYILDDNEKYNNLYKYLSKKENTEYISINNKNYNIEDWLKSIKECKFLITDSFHGVCFALIFEKPFICIRNKNRGNARFDSLIEIFKIGKNFIYSIDEILNNKIDFNCNYSEIKNKLNIIRNKNLDKIEDVLNNNFSNNPNLKQNKKENHVYLKKIYLFRKINSIKFYLKYLRCKIMHITTLGTKKEHYKHKTIYFKKLFENGGNI